MTKLYDQAEEFIKSIYWSETHDKANSLNIPDVISERLVKENAEKDPEYYNHRPGVIHASSLSKCLRGVVHEMLGAEKDSEPDARKLGIFKAGNLFEDYIVESLSDKMLDRQTEYVYVHNEVILTGRDDGTILHEGERRMLEAKSVHSNSFWHREKEGTLVAYQNQMQIQTYLWLRRILPNVFHRKHYEDTGVETEIIYTNMTKQALWEYRGSRPDDKLEPQEKPDDSALNGIFTYISKDDCTIAQAPVKYNQRIIDETVLPALEAVRLGYINKNPNQVESPPLVRYEASRGQWTKNWLCNYCEYHTHCAGKGWVLEAQDEVARKNREQKETMVNNFQEKPAKPILTTKPVPVGAPTIGVDLGTPEGDKAVTVEAQAMSDGSTEVKVVEEKPHVPPPEGETTLERMMREQKGG